MAEIVGIVSAIVQLTREVIPSASEARKYLKKKLGKKEWKKIEQMIQAALEKAARKQYLLAAGVSSGMILTSFGLYYSISQPTHFGAGITFKPAMTLNIGEYSTRGRHRP